MRIRYAGSTHVGLKRLHNEDSYFLLAEENLYVVADGMGGHASGEVASRLAVESLAQFYAETGKDKEVTWPFKENQQLSYEENRLVTGIKVANQRIYEQAQANTKLQGMGTTIVSLVASPGGAYLGHVGDSRGYRLRGSEITQLTEDHSLLNDYLKIHPLSEEEIAQFPHKNVIVRALGMRETVAVDIHRISPRNGDIYLLCTDGLSGMLSDKDILRTLNDCQRNIKAGCEELIRRANHQGGQDNVTVVLVEFLS